MYLILNILSQILKSIVAHTPATWHSFLFEISVLHLAPYTTSLGKELDVHDGYLRKGELSL